MTDTLTDALLKHERHNTVAETRYWLGQVKLHARQLERDREELMEALRDVLASGFTDIDPRIRYLEVQISKSEWAGYKAILSRLETKQSQVESEKQPNSLPSTSPTRTHS